MFYFLSTFNMYRIFFVYSKMPRIQHTINDLQQYFQMIDTIAKFTSQIWMCLTMLHIKQDVSDSTVSCTKLHVCPFPDMWVEVWQQRSTWPKIKRRQVLTMTKSLDNEHFRSMSASHINKHQRRSIKIMRTTANSKSQNRVSVLQITAQMMTTSNSFNYKFKECH